MLSGNRLSTLPESLSMCSRLELVRLGANNLQGLPPCILKLPQLAWLCFGGNPMTAAAETRSLDTGNLPCSWKQLELHERLGEGASGVIYRATLLGTDPDACNSTVAVKVFKSGVVTSDGRPTSEVAAWTLAGEHSSIIPVLRGVVGAPDGGQALLMPIVDRTFTAIAAPPSFESCTRDVYVL